MAEPRRKVTVLRRCQMLAFEEHHLMAQQRFGDFGDDNIIKRHRKIDVADHSTDRWTERGDTQIVERGFEVPRRRLAGNLGTCHANWWWRELCRHADLHPLVPAGASLALARGNI